MIQRPGEAAFATEIGPGLTLGTGDRDGIRTPGLSEGALVASRSDAGIVLEARTTGILVGGCPLAPGRRRLLRTGERAEAGGVLLWEEPRPEETRVRAGAILLGEEPDVPDGPHLIVIEGPCAGGYLALRDGCVLGRGDEAELRLEDPHASRRHAIFSLRRGRPCLRDLSSKNGLAVNGRRAGRRRITLRAGDTLALGDSMLLYQEGPRAARANLEPTRVLAAAARTSRTDGERRSVRAAAGTVALMTLVRLLALAAG